MSAVNLTIGKRLRARRRMLNLTQAQLGDRVGVRFQQIQKYEVAANQISAARLWQLAEALGVSPGYFFPEITGARETVVEEGMALQ